MFSWFKKHRPAQTAKLSDWDKTCRDCGVENGCLHDLFCTKEECPFCGGQLMTCDCLADVLKLGEEERKVVDEYIDDSIEPLKGIMERWKAVLDRKGRIPFQTTPLAINAQSLILTAALGELPFVRQLMANGVSVNAKNEVGYTPLMAAARSYRHEVVLFLLETGADVHATDVYGHTPMHCAVGSPTDESPAAQEAQAECVRLLLQYGAHPDAKDEHGGTPLMDAAWFGCASSIPHLLRAGADPSARDDRGRTAEQLARERYHEDIAKFLVGQVSDGFAKGNA